MVAPKVLPCVGCCYPLHHFGASWRCSALLHWGIHPWCSRSPFGHPLRHVSTRSGPCAPFSFCLPAPFFLPLCGCPCVCCLFCPFFSVLPPLSLFRLPLIWGAFSVFLVPSCLFSFFSRFRALFLVLRFPSCASVALARSSHIVVLIERITHMHTLYPSLGFESGAQTIQSEVLSVQTRRQNRTQKTHKQNKNQTKQNNKS